jgi:predicted nucleic acid-binding protein
LVSSAAVIEELSRGDYPDKSQCLELVSRLPLLPIEPIIEGIVDRYIDNHVMPRDPSGDALHLAIASYHKCEFLVTWNCQHLANANKFGHIRQLNTLLGLHVPTIVTPLELLDNEEQDERPNN